MKQPELMADFRISATSKNIAEEWIAALSKHQLLYLYHCLQKFYFRAMRPCYISFLKNQDNCVTSYTRQLAYRCEYPFLKFSNEIKSREMVNSNIDDPGHPYYLWLEEKLFKANSGNQ